MRRTFVALILSALTAALTALAAAAPQAGSWAPSDAGLQITRTPPDPPPLTERRQWVFDLRWDRGEVFLVGTHGLELSAPQTTPRAMGRFALELYEGPTLIERVRFDFPLLGAPDVDSGSDPLAAKLKTRIGVVFPATPRGTGLQLWDRATGQRWALPWPPPQPAGDASADATAEGG